MADDYGPDSHEVWVLENIAYPSTCIDVITGYDSPQPSPVMASCAYTGEQPSRFEAFYLGKNANGVSVYEMKSIYDWDLYRSYGDRCLANGIGEYYVQLRPCNSPDTTWSVTAAA